MHIPLTHPSRRARTALVGATALALVLAGCAADDSDGSGNSDDSSELSGQIVWADFGGPTNEARYAAYFDDFTDETGVEVISETYGDAIVNTMLTGGTGPYDAIHVGLDNVYQHKDNIAPLDPSVGRDEVLPEDIRDYAFGTFLVGHVQAYLTETFPDGGPQTWADFWDVTTFPGSRGWMGSPGSYDSACEMASLAAGIDPDQLYPLDLDLCTEKLDELRPHMVFYTSYPQIQQLLTSQTAAVVAGPSGQAAALQNEGLDVTISFDQALVAPNVLAIPATAPNMENIQALAAVFHEPARQAAFAKLTGYGPGNPEAFDFMDEETQARIVNAPAHQTIVYQDAERRAEQSDDLLAWYTEWLAG